VQRGLDPRIYLPEKSLSDESPDPLWSGWEEASGDDNVEAMPTRLFLSSGDLVADRRFDFARDLQLKGDLVAAADLLLQAIELAPTFASAWFTLGEIRNQLGERDAAIAAFQQARAADPDDRHGASLRLMLLGAEKLLAMPQAYVRALFDQYAPKFESALVGDLGYRGPALLSKAVLAARVAVRKPAFFKRAIDLGCGTGLAAAAFAKAVDHFTGIDLSPRMIEQARATGLYAQLELADMVHGLRGKPDASADLILAADAMVYLPDHVPLLREVRRVLAPGGLLAFTVETHDGEGVILGEGLRYAHGAASVRASIGDARLTLSRLEDLSARNEDNVPVPGLVVVAEKT
jgi:predicted TPR repeat methyltransferase